MSSQPAASSVYSAYQGNTYLFGGNAPYVEEMYENYLANPGSVTENWRDYFDAPGFLILGKARSPSKQQQSR